MKATPKQRVLMTGGTGLLGGALRALHPDIIAPTHQEMDLLDVSAIERVLGESKPDVVIHAAALTGPIRCAEKPIEAMRANIVGTANIVQATQAKGIRLVYISTDYVFKGDKGNYREEDELLPQNYYAWSKLGGECAVRAHDRALIVRTTFSPDVFPYDKAFVDQYTSRDALSVIAPMLYEVALRDDVIGVLHVGTERKTVKELALKLGKVDVQDLYLKDVTFNPPADTSFDLSRLHNLRGV